MIKIRAEQTADIEAIYEVNKLAFETPAEAELVNKLREAGAITLSLVALKDEQLVGHALFSPITIKGGEEFEGKDGQTAAGVALGPIAVHPHHQRQGIGALLIQAGIQQLANAGHNALIVLGHPNYYPRFGFVPASRFNISSEYNVPDEVFMAQMLDKAALAPAGLAKYHPAFAGV